MDNKKIGNFLVLLRKAKGLTQQQIADLLYVSNKTVSKWECGDALPNIEVLPSLATFFEVTIDEILAGERKDTKNIKLEQNEDLDKNNYLLDAISTRFALSSLINYGVLIFNIILYIILAFTINIFVATIVGFMVNIIALLFWNYSYRLASFKINVYKDKSEVYSLANKIKKKTGIYFALTIMLTYMVFFIFLVSLDMISHRMGVVLGVYVFPIATLLFVLYLCEKILSIEYDFLLKFFNNVKKYKTPAIAMTVFIILIVLFGSPYPIVSGDDSSMSVSDRFFTFLKININKDNSSEYITIHNTIINALREHSDNFTVFMHSLSSFVFLGLAVILITCSIIKNKAMTWWSGFALLISVRSYYTVTQKAWYLTEIEMQKPSWWRLDELGVNHDFLLVTIFYTIAVVALHIVNKKVECLKNQSI